jgi:hypothetical protein
MLRTACAVIEHSRDTVAATRMVRGDVSGRKSNFCGGTCFDEGMSCWWVGLTTVDDACGWWFVE